MKDRNRKNEQHTFVIQTMTTQRNRVTISKYLSKILRHTAEDDDVNLFMDDHGWVDLDQLIAHMRKSFSYVTKELVFSIVETNEKERFELSTLKTMIRATQGHSIKKVDPDLRVISAEEGSIMTAIHGTTSTNLSKIERNGLSRMSRNLIHMIGTPPEKGKVKSGYRSSCNRLIWINVPKAMEQGIKFYQSKNDVILSPGNEEGKIPTDCFLKITEI